MTTTTPDSVGLALEGPRRPSPRFRFGVAFLVGVILATVVGVGALYAFDQQYLGRVLPGVRLGNLDLSGLDEAAAAERIATEYAALGQGEVVVTGPDGAVSIPYAEFGRGPDVDAMVDAAMGVGRGGDPFSRAIANARTAVNGATIQPMVTFDPEALAQRISAISDGVRQEPVDAFVTRDLDGRFLMSPSTPGRAADARVPVQEALDRLSAVDAPAQIRLALPVSVLEPTVTTVEASTALAAAQRLSDKITLTLDGEQHTIPAATLRGWVSFGPTADGGYAPSIDTTYLSPAIKKLAKSIDRKPRNASFRTSGSRIVGVTSSQTGYKTDVKATKARIQALFDARLAGAVTQGLEPATKVTQPALSSSEAKAALPKMRKISTWTTRFQPSDHNGFGTNIWLPARLIDGYVVAPGAKFDFWKAVGPVTRARGFQQGAAIIDGKSEPQGALAGGICSCSTTLFNAALRAGYQMGARANHYYYIDRYPIGLDATVFISNGGSVQTMSFTNDTAYPLLIRGTGYRKGGNGYVRFDLYSVPTGRTVRFSKPVIKDIRPAIDTTQHTKTLAAGQTKRIEYPVDGKKVWVTRVVRDRGGHVIHKETYFSNYKRVDGITLIGTGV
jgi:vancomycin resistance protein YoaR